MKTTVHTAESRGFQNHGWLVANHSFSFANYYNPERVHFGVLRVLNDDFVSAGMGLERILILIWNYYHSTFRRIASQRFYGKFWSD
jgi:hypothetical protein